MRVTLAKETYLSRLTPLGIALALCTASGTARAGSDLQGTSIQGTSIQGTSIQGTSIQGTSIQGTSMQGVNVSGSMLQGTLNGVLKTGTQLTNAEFSISVKPAGSKAIYNLPARIAHVYKDPTLNSMDSPNNRNDSGNGTVWLYKIQVKVQVPGPFNTYVDVWRNLCGVDPTASNPDAYAMFFNGTMTSAGVYQAPSAANGYHSLSCVDGVMAKAARNFGYKPWMTFTSRNPTYPGSVNGLPLWAAMVNAGIANYCGSGRSYTQNGTRIDVRDPWWLNSKSPDDSVFAFAQESAWKPVPSTSGSIPTQLNALFATRWLMTSLSSTEPADCEPQTFANDILHNETPGSDELTVDTSTLCSHSPVTSGKPLSKYCNTCTINVCSASGTHDSPALPYSSCCDQSPGLGGGSFKYPNAWTAECAQKASQVCLPLTGSQSPAAAF